MTIMTSCITQKENQNWLDVVFLMTNRDFGDSTLIPTEPWNSCKGQIWIANDAKEHLKGRLMADMHKSKMKVQCCIAYNWNMEHKKYESR